MDERFEIGMEEDVDKMTHRAPAGYWNVESSPDWTPRPVSSYDIGRANCRDRTTLPILQSDQNIILSLLNTDALRIKPNITPEFSRNSSYPE